jgi:hypothetical protein
MDDAVDDEHINTIDFVKVLKAKFNELVASGNKLVLEQIVTTIASVADTAEEKFIEHYDKFMPCLKYMIGNATTPELRLLRGKTIECVSLIGLAVGGEKFTADASEVSDDCFDKAVGFHEDVVIGNGVVVGQSG